MEDDRVSRWRLPPCVAWPLPCRSWSWRPAWSSGWPPCPLASAGDPCYHDYVLPSDTSASTTQVKLLPCAYSPTVTVVRVGATVTFANVTDFTHLVTGANQAWGSRDAEVAPGKTVSYTFDQAGTYPYACALHRGMSGTIIVSDATPAAAVARSDTAGRRRRPRAPRSAPARPTGGSSS